MFKALSEEKLTKMLFSQQQFRCQGDNCDARRGGRHKHLRGLYIEIDARIAEAIVTIERGFSVNPGKKSTTTGIVMLKPHLSY